MMDYAGFLAAKHREWSGNGREVRVEDLPSGLYPFQAALTRWALRKGRAALWADTGLGKTRMQVAWAAEIPGRVLILAPLCVGPQTIAEAARIGVDVRPLGSDARIEVTNYERLHQITPSDYTGVVLDESSILKSFDGKTRGRLIAAFRETPFRLCCTATPAPNDIAELANHAEFLGIMTRAEMLATWFVHVERDEVANGWRLKGHAHAAFYRWLASWGLFLQRPSDLGFPDDGYALPSLMIAESVVDGIGPSGDYLFPALGLGGLKGRLAARQGSVEARVKVTVALVQRTAGPWIVWCGLNAEQDAVTRLLGDEAVSVAGADDETTKQARLTAFLAGRARVLVSKPRVAGFGLNLQHCAAMVFLGLGDSYEQYYQAIRRCWRFGQARPVAVHIVVSAAEHAIVQNVRRKEREATRTVASLIAAMRDLEREEIGVTTRERVPEERAVAEGEGWRLELGDCVEALADWAPDSVDLSVYSPPFMALYTYTNSERDVGNAADREEFLAHMRYVVHELARVTKPGRLSCCHVQQVMTTKVNHGVIGMVDLRGALIALFQAERWIYHGEVCIDKDPQAQAIRTKAKGLLFVQLHKDSAASRPALADYLLLFRAPGDNAVPITPDLTNEDWIEWARPIWYGLRESDTLNAREAREHDDDRHVCPLQLGTIERAIRLWSNPGELVADPFAGIGSTGYEAIRLGRRFRGVELKRAYWEAAARNLRRMEQTVMAQGRLPL